MLKLFKNLYLFKLKQCGVNSTDTKNLKFCRGKTASGRKTLLMKYTGDLHKYSGK